MAVGGEARAHYDDADDKQTIAEQLLPDERCLWARSVMWHRNAPREIVALTSHRPVLVRKDRHWHQT